MKKIILLIIVSYSLLINNCFSQWQPDFRLTTSSADSKLSGNNARCIEANWSIVHVVYYDFRDGNYEIYYKRSTDNGTSWATGLRLTNNSAESSFPSVAVSGLLVHVVWPDSRDGNYEIYYKRSTDGGINWGTDTRLTNNSAVSSVPSVSVSGSAVHITWQDLRDGNYEIYYKRSTDGGVNWGADTRLTNNSSQSNDPSATVSGSVVHVVWQDYRDGNEEIYYKRSTDGGLSWGTDTRLTNNSAISIYPSVIASGLNIHVVWIDDRDGNDEIYYQRSTDGGVNWESNLRLTNNNFHSENPFITVSGTIVHVVWTDDRNGNYSIYYKQNPTGNPIGIKSLSTEIPTEYSLSQNYPNPFNPVTKIRFAIPPLEGARGRIVKLIIFNILGMEVAALVNEQLKAGTYEVDFDGTNYPSGVYYYSINAGSFSQTKKMVLLK